MIWPFKKTLKPIPNPQIEQLVNELRTILENAPKDSRTPLERFGPYSKPEPSIDPLSEANVYLVYGRIGGAIDVLKGALESQERIAELAWLPQGELYVREVLSRLERLSNAYPKESAP